MQRITILLLTFVSFTICCFGQSGNFIPSERFSSGLINDICQDNYGYMWVATDYGLNKFDGYRFTTYLHDPTDSLTISSNVAGCVYCDRNGQLWVGTSKGLDRYDYATDEFVHYPFESDVNPRVSKLYEGKDGRLIICTSGFRGLYTISEGKSIGYGDDSGVAFVNSVLEDSKGRFWQCGFGNEFSMRDNNGVHKMISTQGLVVDFAERQDEVLIFGLHGIHSYRNGELSVADIDLDGLGKSNVIIRRVFKDHNGNIYIGTRGDGLFRLAKDSRKLEQIESITSGIDLKSAKVWAITEDRQGNIWLGCQSKGLMMISNKPQQFHNWSFEAQGLQISSTVTSVCKGDGGITWCTVQGNGVYGFDTKGRVISHPTSPSPTELIYRDRQGNYWIGTDDALYSYHPQTGQATKVISVNCDRINNMTDDGQGNLYISTFSQGFCVYNTQTRQLRTFSSKDQDSNRGWLCNNWVMAMTVDHAGRIWLATSNGVSCYDPKAESFRPFGWHQLLEGVLCYSLCTTQRGHLLIGTEKGLYIYEPGKQQAEPFHESDGLRNKVIGSIVEANNGDIWCATSMGIWQFDLKKNTFIGHVNGNGLTTKEYINCVGLHIDSDIVYFANNSGLTVFNPAEVIGSHSELPEVMLTGFLIAGKPVNTLTRSDGGLVADKPTIESEYFHVSYLDNTLSLEFSLLDYNNPDNIIFEYRISGGQWMQNQEGQNSIRLSHLQPGTYNIEVRALASGIYSKTKTITVTVRPPWYRTSLAYTLYVIGVLSILGFIGWTLKRRASRQLDEEKMKFLINATHDIRSPLTLIMSPLAKLKNLVTDEMGKTYIDTIDRNAQRLMTLVNQILDERKIDKGQMQLHCQETNIVDLISGVCRLFQYEAQQRNINFTFEHELNNVPAWVDRINFDKVVSNLLSNAFKYTSDGGDVTVRLNQIKKAKKDDHVVEIQVVDSGIGFRDGENTKHLFERFHQGSNSVNLNMQGTGIGLNLCRNIVEMHSGQIKAGNRTDGQRGACFTVTLPSGNKHLKAEQIVENERKNEVLSTNTSRKHKNIRVLLVDDDQEIPDFIRFELGSYYKFTVCPNGKEALKALLTEGTHYDIVVSDIMMPEMDGIELLHRIKENPHTSDIPVILLTSKTEVSYRLEGLKKGADAYLSKPFDMEELHVQIDNLVGTVQRLRGVFSGASTQKDKVEDIELKGNDDQLMERIMKSVNANISDPDYNVESLAKDVGLSRAQLHRKMKEMTGLATGKFVRDIRMQQAGRLIREGRVNVSQVAYSVGFSDQAHFSTVFKTYFGMTPSEYAIANKE